jgi:hypothetical protein
MSVLGHIQTFGIAQELPNYFVRIGSVRYGRDSERLVQGGLTPLLLRAPRALTGSGREIVVASRSGTEMACRAGIPPEDWC